MADRLRLASITLLRDEATIIEAFHRHNIRFIDRMYVVDDGCRDTTLDIIALLKEEGLDIVLIDQPRSGAFYLVHKMASALARILTDSEWDAIVPLDTDEFLVADSRAAFERDIAGIPSGCVGGLSPIHYALSDHDDPTIESDLERIRHGLDTWPRVWKVIVPERVAKHEKAAFSEGNHAFLVDGVATPAHLLRTRLVHFRARAPDELVARSIAHYIRWRSREDYTEGTTEHRMRIVRAIAESPSLAISEEFAGRIASRFLIGKEPEELVPVPFDATHAVTRFKHLATMKPYAIIVAAIDDLIADSRTTPPAGAEERAKEVLARLATARKELAQAQAQLAAARAELGELRGSNRRLLASALELIRRRLRNSIAKRRARWAGRPPV
jgi:hypothetical protein